MLRQKSAKDIAFDRERATYRKEINDLKNELKSKQDIILSQKTIMSKLESDNNRLNDWISRLMDYVDINEEDMKMLVKKDVSTAIMINNFNEINNALRMFGMSYPID